MKDIVKKINQIVLIVLLITCFTLSTAGELPVEIVKQVNVAESLTYTGTIEAINKGTASAQTSGRVVQTLVDVGDLVNKDDVILKLRDTQQRANYDSAVAGVNSANAKYISAEKEYIRVINILTKGLVSQSAADNALAQREGAKAAFDVAKASLQNAQEQLEYTRVKAPYSGIVLERHVEVGETVNSGSPLYTGMSLEQLRVLVNVPQKDIDNIRRNKSAKIELPDGNFITISGEALTFFAYADPQTSSFKIRVNLPEGLHGLYPGMYLKTSFKVGDKTSIVISNSSLIRRGEVTAVYVIDENRLTFRQVRVGRKIEVDMIEVLSGLSEGEKVITSAVAAIEYIQSQPSERDE